MLPFLVTPCLVVAAQPCMEGIPIKKKQTNYGVNKDTGADNPDIIKYSTRVLKPNLCDDAEAYILVDGIIRASNAVNATRFALKNCAPFTKCNL